MMPKVPIESFWHIGVLWTFDNEMWLELPGGYGPPWWLPGGYMLPPCCFAVMGFFFLMSILE